MQWKHAYWPPGSYWRGMLHTCRTGEIDRQGGIHSELCGKAFSTSNKERFKYVFDKGWVNAFHQFNIQRDTEYTDEFGQWWDGLTEGEQESVRTSVKLPGDLGPKLPFPHSSGVTRSKHANMRELRIQHAGRQYRVLYAFDPLRCAILLIGGEKTGRDGWYDEYLPIADRPYDEHFHSTCDDRGNGGHARNSGSFSRRHR